MDEHRFRFLPPTLQTTAAAIALLAALEPSRFGVAGGAASAALTLTAEVTRVLLERSTRPPGTGRSRRSRPR